MGHQQQCSIHARQHDAAHVIAVELTAMQGAASSCRDCFLKEGQNRLVQTRLKVVSLPYLGTVSSSPATVRRRHHGQLHCILQLYHALRNNERSIEACLRCTFQLQVLASPKEDKVCKQAATSDAHVQGVHTCLLQLLLCKPAEDPQRCVMICDESIDALLVGNYLREKGQGFNVLE